MRRRIIVAGALALTGMAGLTGQVVAQGDPTTTTTASAEAETRDAEPPADFGERVSAAAQRGPEYPPECGNFGSWVSALAQSRQCTPPPPEELAD